jgi:amino acid adenylation domain-containing protein
MSHAVEMTRKCTRLVHELFEDRVDAAPTAVAVEAASTAVDYAVLDAEANRLAHHLVGLGAGPGRLVAICLDRGVAMMVAALAVLKSGAAYVPLDPHYPSPRLGEMLKDCGAMVVIVDDGAALRLPSHRARAVNLDREQASIAAAPADRLEPKVGPGDPAYVIYTSGSTGTPKGVVVPHAGVENLAEVVACEFATGPGARVLQFASFSFDAWVAELAMSLLSGGTLVIAARAQLASPELLHDLLAEARIDVVTLPPSVLALLEPAGLAGLRTVCAAGETCSWEVARRWAAPGRRFLNGYGPTEVTVAAAYHRLDRLERPDAVTVPIGAPIANKRAYVMDEQLRELPDGEPGELVIAGAGVALGYLGRPELTSERFVTDPGSLDPNARAYRTGDLVRRLGDGQLEFIGRVDDQVKVRGFRIEPGEIDAALRAHDQVRDAVTITRSDASGPPQLVSYVIGGPGGRALREHLRAVLPEWMVPNAVVAVDAFPLTPNGKIDTRALPAPRQVAAGGVAPRTPVERAVADVFAEVLGLERVTTEDDFLALGGDSLRATQAASRLTSVLAHEVAPEWLFESPTPAELAMRVVVELARAHGGRVSAELHRLSLPKRTLLERRLLASARAAGPERIPRRAPGDPAPLSFAQYRLWFLDQLRPGEHIYNAALPMIVRGHVDRAALQHALDAVIERHEVMRTIYPAGEDGQPSQVVLPDARVPLSVADFSHLPPGQRRQAAIDALREEGCRPFDLTSDVTTRARLIKLSDDEYALVIVSHHICCDGWSRDVLFRDLGAFYDAFHEGRAAQLPPLPIQYADYAVWQRRWLTGEVLERQVAYWRETLAGVPTTLDLPTHRPRPRMQSFRGAFHWFTLSAELAGLLGAISRVQRATLYQTLLAGYATLVFARSGQGDFLVGSPIANRHHLELESLVGFFSNTLVVRVRVSAEQTFRELIDDVRRTTLGGYAHQDLPFEKVVEVLRPPRDTSRNPLFQTNFRAQGVPLPRLDLGGAPVEMLELDLATARFDFAMDLRAEDDGSLRGYFEYSTDLFTDATAVAMAADYASILAEAAARPDAPLGQLAAATRAAANRA